MNDFQSSCRYPLLARGALTAGAAASNRFAITVNFSCGSAFQSKLSRHQKSFCPYPEAECGKFRQVGSVERSVHSFAVPNQKLPDGGFGGYGAGGVNAGDGGVVTGQLLSFEDVAVSRLCHSVAII